MDQLDDLLLCDLLIIQNLKRTHKLLEQKIIILLDLLFSSGFVQRYCLHFVCEKYINQLLHFNQSFAIFCHHNNTMVRKLFCNQNIAMHSCCKTFHSHFYNTTQPEIEKYLELKIAPKRALLYEFLSATLQIIRYVTLS